MPLAIHVSCIFPVLAFEPELSVGVGRISECQEEIRLIIGDCSPGLRVRINPGVGATSGGEAQMGRAPDFRRRPEGDLFIGPDCSLVVFDTVTVAGIGFETVEMKNAD